jgi:DNA-binding NarL/FixJ family response regulator
VAIEPLISRNAEKKKLVIAIATNKASLFILKMSAGKSKLNFSLDYSTKYYQILGLYDQGKSTREIAKDLRVSLRDIGFILQCCITYCPVNVV